MMTHATSPAPETPSADWSSEDLGLVLLEAVSNHNDVDGVSWRGVAREVAEALGIALSDYAASAEARA